jgi:hypothetical protein
MPPVPRRLRPRLREVERWVYSSRDLPGSPYEIGECIDDAVSTDVGDYVVVAHAGHGINSWGLHYFLVYSSLLLFVRVAWGGVYTDAARATATANAAFKACRTIVEAAAKVEGQGKPRMRILVCADEFMGVQCCRFVDADSGETLRDVSLQSAAPIDSFLETAAADLPRLLRAFGPNAGSPS